MFKSLFIVSLALVTLTAYPAIIAKAELMDGSMLLFTDEVRKCSEGAKAFDYIPSNKANKTLQGCYMPTPRGLYLVDEEGDSGIVPYEALRKPTDA